MTDLSTDQALGAYLQALRIGAGVELSALARRVSLSVAQLSQLESGQSSLFYNRRIRLQAARKVISHLGGDLTRVPSADAVSESPGAVASVSAQPLAAPAVATAAPAAADPAPEQSTGVPVPPGKPSAPWRSGWTLFILLATGVALVLVLAGRRSGQDGSLVALAPQPSPAGQTLEPAARPLPAEGPASSLAPAVASPVSEPAADAARPESLPPPLACLSLGDPSVPSLPSTRARKAGDMVHVISFIPQQVCLTDATGRQQRLRLEPGEGRSVYGQPPWLIRAEQLQQTQMFFQGWRVQLPADAGDRVQLVELAEPR